MSLSAVAAAAAISLCPGFAGSVVISIPVDGRRCGSFEISAVALCRGDSLSTSKASCSGRYCGNRASTGFENVHDGPRGRHGSSWSWNSSFYQTNSTGALVEDFRVGQRKCGKVQCSLSRGADAREQDRETTVREISELAGSLVSLKRLIAGGYRAIGPEMRDRVDRLYDRVVILEESAKRAVTNQLVASLRALQREQGSLENIIRLAMEAEPSLASLESTEGASELVNRDTDKVEQEDLGPKASVFQSLIRQSQVEPLPATPPVPNYVMTAPASQGSPLAAFRAEIERRVMKQLSEKSSGSSVERTEEIDFKNLASSSEVRSPSSEKTQSVEEPEADGLRPVQKFQDTREGLPISLRKCDPGSGSDLSNLTSKEKIEATMNAIETDSLRKSMNTIREELQGLKQIRLRADMVESKMQQMEVDLARSIPLELHEQMVRNLRASLTDARVKVLRVTNEVKEKEALLETVKKSMLAEQETLANRVRELSGDLTVKVSREEMEEAVAYAVGEVEKELERVHQRAVTLSIELERKDRLLIQQQDEWKLIREGLEKEITGAKQKLYRVNKARTNERAQLIEAQQKVKALELEVARLHDNAEEARQLRLKSKKETLATVSVLISHMVQSQRARAKSERQAVSLVQEVAKLQEENKALERVKRAAEEKAEWAVSEVEEMKCSLASVGKEVESLQATLESSQRTIALENFFAAMAQLIKREEEKMKYAPYKFLQTEPLAETEGNLGEDILSKSGGNAEEAVTLVTLRYETSWEWAYLHFKADDSGWTDVPGVLMQNGVNESKPHQKVLMIQASSVEFVLNDGKGSWDIAPGGGNYFIHEPGSYYLSNGRLQKIQ